MFSISFLKFIFYGGLNTLLAYSILVLFLYLNFHYTLATFISGIISILTGYLINKYLVFFSKKSKSLLIYYLFWFILYLLNIFIQFFLLEVLNNKNLYMNSLISTVIVSLVSFVINKNYFFKD